MSESLKKISPNALQALKPFLDEAVEKYEQPEFINRDPISFVYAFDQQEDKVLAGFFAALMAWGRRSVILSKTEALLKRMNYQPASFIRNFKDEDGAAFKDWKHRTFKPVDIFWLVKSLQKMLNEYDNFESFWHDCYQSAKKQDKHLLTVFHHEFFSYYPQVTKRTYKHIAYPAKNSSCKRLCMFLRWMIRKSSAVDPGIMDFMQPSELFIPLDVHVARQARILGLLSRKYNDWKAVAALTQTLRQLDPNDPTKYDFALFSLGVKGRQIPEKLILNKDW